MSSESIETIVQNIGTDWVTSSVVAAKINARAANIGAILKILAKKGHIQHRWVTEQRPRTGIKRFQEYRINN